MLKRTNKTSNVRNNEQSPNSKKAISSHKEIKSTHYEKSVSRSEVDDRSLSVGKERGIEESEKPDDQLTDLKAVSTTSGGDEESLRNEADTDRKTESEIRKDKTESKIESKAANADFPDEPLKNYFGFHASDNDIQRVCSADLGTITVRENPENNTIWLILEYKDNVNLVNAIESLIQTLQKHRKDIVIECVRINEISDIYEPRIDEHFSLKEFQKAVKENKTLWQYGLGGYGKGYPISDVTSAWFPARVDFSVDDIEATVHMGDGRVSIECSYGNKTLRRQKLSADDIGAKLIFESILDTSK